jgi:O-antigen/teichoic acid export membrane protein
MNRKKNIFSALVFQCAHIVYGLVLPRLILGTFGSSINGLVSSIAQFLGFISLLEGGLGAVVLSELYAPIEENDHERIKGILQACQRFFCGIAIVFGIYTILVGVGYSFALRHEYDMGFVLSLVVILSLTILARYLFSITLKLYLQANQQIFIINLVGAATLSVNLALAFVVINVYPEIRLLKLASSIVFFVQPLIYRHFVPKRYRSHIIAKAPIVALKNRWSGFAQHLAHYVNMNTDIVLITLFCSLKDVSVYVVYLLGINATKSIIDYLTNSYQSVIGKYIAQRNQERLEKEFKAFCVATWAVVLGLFGTCLLVINPFVKVYVENVNDANYHQPLFALVIALAYLVYCLREPYRLLILAAGKFKETNFGSVMEAVLNIVVSLVLIQSCGIVGVAIGTFVAVSYRMVYFIVVIKKTLLHLRLRDYWHHVVAGMLLLLLNLAVYQCVTFDISSFVGFFVLSALVFLGEALMVCLLFVGPGTTLSLIRKVLPCK